MATVGMRTDRVYTEQPMALRSEPFKVRARLTMVELLALAAVIGACVSLIGYEYGVRRPAREAAAASAKVTTPRIAAPTPAAAPAPAAMPGQTGPTAATVTAAASASVEAASRPAFDATASNKTMAARGAGEPSRAGDDPFQTPGTIYRCRRYDGTLFWSAVHCAKHRGALIDRIARVPAGLPFDAQVRAAADDAKRFETSLRAEQAELQRMNTCASLVGEQAQILRRAGDATVLSQVQSADRVRGREIEATLHRLRCNG